MLMHNESKEITNIIDAKEISLTLPPIPIRATGQIFASSYFLFARLDEQNLKLYFSLI